MNTLTILIPTYNRSDFLYKNVTSLFEMIREKSLEQCIIISISNNASTDNTKEILRKLEREAGNVQLQVNHNENNIGISKNLMGLLEHVETEFAMVLGDDDFIEPDYLYEIMYALSDKSISCILPSYQNVTVSGEPMKRSRDIGKRVHQFKKGYYNCFVNSWRGHQLSGLVFRVDNLYEKSRAVGLNNLYLFVYWISESCLNGSTLHLTTYPVKVTRPAQSAKAWSYGKDGLVGEFFQNYKLLSEVSYIKRGLLELKFLYVQYWRYAMYLKLGLRAFLQCIWNIIISPNTTYITKILFVFYIPIVGISQCIHLLLSGKLSDVLSTKVEV